MISLIPGLPSPAACVVTRPIGGEGAADALAVHLTLHPTAYEPTEGGAALDLHTLALAPLTCGHFRCSRHAQGVAENAHQDRWVRSAGVVVRQICDVQPPFLALDAMMRRYPQASVCGAVIDERSCIVGIRTGDPFGANGHDSDAGFAVMMTCEDDAPAPLFASALDGWRIWWRRRASELTGRIVRDSDLPPPPLDLNMRVQERSFQIRLEDHERTVWPQLPPPPPPPPDWSDDRKH
ncbi:hypothetical protein AB0P17_24360 [Streptomyces sp. NPDC088124]|uniref:hypothetical protein n=1 Tax=Streptomyces sp. NPDC088124 TaxID=3154654 RepID=UPI00341F850F